MHAQAASQVGLIVEDGWSAWGELAWAVRTGDNAFQRSHEGKTIWEYMKVHLPRMLRPMRTPQSWFP